MIYKSYEDLFGSLIQSKVKQRNIHKRQSQNCTEAKKQRLKDKEFKPGTLMKWLEGRLPQPVDDLEQWSTED